MRPHHPPSLQSIPIQFNPMPSCPPSLPPSSPNSFPFLPPSFPPPPLHLSGPMHGSQKHVSYAHKWPLLLVLVLSGPQQNGRG